MEQGAGSREQGAESRELGAWSVELGLSVALPTALAFGETGCDYYGYFRYHSSPYISLYPLSPSSFLLLYRIGVP